MTALLTIGIVVFAVGSLLAAGYFTTWLGEKYFAYYELTKMHTRAVALKQRLSERYYDE
jgi:hypothetical protein